jgi:tRNA 2-thiouridine synthesizing protein D
MDAPFESARATTFFRLLDIAARRGFRINVFAYEGAVYLPFAPQKPHANQVHGRDVDAERHPLPKDWVAAIAAAASAAGGTLDWVNCGLCCDERGALDLVPSVRRGSPADFWRMATASTNTLAIGTR